MLGQGQTCTYLCGSGVLTNQTVVHYILDFFGHAVGFDVGGRRIKTHLNAHQTFADQIRLGWLFHADGDVRFTHWQIQNTFFQHQIDFKFGIFFI